MNKFLIVDKLNIVLTAVDAGRFCALFFSLQCKSTTLQSSVNSLLAVNCTSRMIRFCL